MNKYCRRFIALCLCLMMACGAALAVSITYKTITVQYAGIQIEVDGVKITPKDVNGNMTEPFIYNGTTYVPARAVAEALGKTVGWNDAAKTVVIGDAEAVASALPDITLKHFLQIALQPVGSTMYVWGGGWNEADDGAGVEAVSIGVSPQWKTFFEKQSADYNYQNTRYQIHDGLDCSGYVGWAIYNLLNTQNGNDGYVMGATQMAQNFAQRGWGTYTAAANVMSHTPGDIMSTKGHVYIVVGQCADGSIVLMHASPPGVQLSGTATPDGKKESDATALAAQYMKTYYSAWYAKYPDGKRGTSYLTNYNQMTWDVTGNILMSDPDNIAAMSAAEVLRVLFPA